MTKSISAKKQNVHSKKRTRVSGDKQQAWRLRRNSEWPTGARYSLECPYVSVPKLRLYTCIYNYSKYPVFSLTATTNRVPPKQILALYLDVLTSGIMDNGEHNRRKRNNENRTHHGTQLFL